MVRNIIKIPKTRLRFLDELMFNQNNFQRKQIKLTTNSTKPKTNQTILDNKTINQKQLPSQNRKF
jgi:hypothetical protein